MRTSSKYIVYGTEGLEVVHDGQHHASTAPQLLPYGSELAQRGSGLEVAQPDPEVVPYGSESAQRGAGLHAVQPGLMLCDEKFEPNQPGLERARSSISSFSEIVKEDLNDKKRDGRICGFRKKSFYVLCGFAVFMILALALGLGFGLMFGLRAANTPAPVEPTSSSTTASSSLPSTSSGFSSMGATGNLTIPATTAIATATSGATTATGMVTKTTAVPTTSAAASTASASASASAPIVTPQPIAQSPSLSSSSDPAACPGSNNTLFLSNSQTFQLFCGYSVNAAGMQRLSTSAENTFSDCITFCASMDYYQGRTDVSALYQTNGGSGMCNCLGGTPANVTRRVFEDQTNWLALIQ